MVRDWDPDWQLVQPLDPARAEATTPHLDLDRFQDRIDAVIEENLQRSSPRAEPASTPAGRVAAAPNRRASARRTSATKRSRRATG
jgi:hypothetical protein